MISAAKLSSEQMTISFQSKTRSKAHKMDTPSTHAHTGMRARAHTHKNFNHYVTAVEVYTSRSTCSIDMGEKKKLTRGLGLLFGKEN